MIILFISILITFTFSDINKWINCYKDYTSNDK